MPHQCVRCGKMHEDGTTDLLKGCSCGGKFFFFIKSKTLEEAKNKIQINLTPQEKKQIETDIREIIGEDKVESPIVLDLECINILKPGKYEIDIVELFKGRPVVYRMEEGKYFIDLASTFKAKKLS